MSAEEDEYDFLCKIILLGDSGVGKTNLMQRFTKNTFNPESRSTIGVDFSSKTVQIGEHRVKAQVWDTAGQERFGHVMQSYYRNVMGAVIVYDITNRTSFDELPGWISKIQENSSNAVILLVGNKSDMIYLRAVQTDEGISVAKKFHMAFMETSALESTNVDEAFKTIIKEIIHVHKLGTKISSSETPTVTETISAPISITQTQPEPVHQAGKQKCAC